MTVPEELCRAVRARAGARCQYCLMHESLQGATFHIERVIPLSPIIQGWALRFEKPRAGMPRMQSARSLHFQIAIQSNWRSLCRI